MNIVIELLQKYFKQNLIFTIIIILLSFILNIIQTNVVTKIIANIIDALENNNNNLIQNNFKIFIIISILYLILYAINKYFQNNLLTKLSQWIRKEFFELILKNNNEELSQRNMMNYNTPILRISTSLVSIIYDFINNIMTNITFIIIISIYFFYKNTTLGVSFLFANIIIIIYIYYFWDNMLEIKSNYENISNRNEKHLVDIFNNFNKIIYRGKINEEIDKYNVLYDNCIKSASEFYSYSNNHILIINTFIYVIVFLTIWYLIQLRKNENYDIKLIITFITITLLYRDRISTIVQSIPYDYVDIIGRVQYVTTNLDDLKFNDINSHDKINNEYKNIDLNFNKIEFKNITFKYKSSDIPVMSDYNYTINLDDGNIIGIKGLSGKGKSTLMKLILRLYKPQNGMVLIDNININNIDPLYLRHNITFVDQDSYLFDKKIIYNIMYGCNDKDVCLKNLDKIMADNKIKNLFKDIDFSKNDSGSLGSNLSGGQKQVINIISGLINPSKILIIDEPTNGLDYELKMIIIKLIKEFSKYKKNIIIISHDKDVYPLFDKTIYI